MGSRAPNDHPARRSLALGRVLGRPAELGSKLPRSYPASVGYRADRAACTVLGMKQALGLLCLMFAVGLSNACSSDAGDKGDGGPCDADDQDGVLGGTNTVLLSVSDSAFAVGGVDSGSMQPNIAVENSSTVKLTVTNTGTTPHSFVVACIPSGLPASCNQPTSCFPDAANIPAIDPGKSVTVMFMTPAVEGAYQFTSDVKGDTTTDKGGNVAGLVGEFVLM